MTILSALILIVLGALAFFYAHRLVVLAAAAGALLGFSISELYPSTFGGGMQTALIAGIAALLAALAYLGKAYFDLVASGVGFVIGTGIALSVLSNFEAMALSLVWIIALLAGLVVALAFKRFLDWSVINFSSFLSALLVVIGATAIFPELLGGVIGPVIVGALTGIGIYYQNRRMRPCSI